ncbi:RHS repeat-associated core domain-containing protein [Pseudomonas mosselii]|uniref:RHS repeat-associated core domain-containing protein n=1 Tax=Pseudomonas mosselii TaxID=78327 RepID=UPI0021A56DFD|nr:RHS repeat-associated core domain-containing protein [Pseudomonas mosselii]MEA3233666.1 RHS repeat-associated core domain-containing protein [Pseudomonas mosselii]UWS64964.1 RHS repeat-associated core domain-containing protein [Pseudomonas mosselii]
MEFTYLAMIDRQHSLLGGSGLKRAYSPYGGLADTVSPSLAYCGQLRDPATGSYVLGNGYRTFSPALMRFHSPDRLSPFGAGGVNAYAYCQGDPVNFTDPNGRMRQTRQSSSTIAPGPSVVSPTSMINDAAMLAGALVLQDGAILKYMLGTEYYVRQARPHLANEDHGRLPRTPSAMEYAKAVGSGLTSMVAGISGLVNKWQPEPTQTHADINLWLAIVSTYTSGKVSEMLSEWKELHDTARNIARAVTANGATIAQVRDGSAARTLDQLRAQDGGGVGQRMDTIRAGAQTVAESNV